MGDGLYDTIRLLFKSKRRKPTTKQELKCIYISMLKHIAGVDIIKSRKETTYNSDNRREMIYTLSHDTIRHHLMLNQYKNPDGKDFLPELHELLKPYVDRLKH